VALASQKIVAGAFGFIAAEVDLLRVNKVSQ
jgi:hypothetical protein